MELTASMGGVKADFVLIQEHHLKKLRLTRFEEMLRNEWLCYVSEAYGENGINGGVAILKRKITIFPQNDAKLCKEE